MTMDTFDLVVIGGGPGGYVAAIRAAKLGLKTALVEERQIGGTCLNRGCIPTKTLMHSAQTYRELQNLEKIGLSVEHPSFDMQRIHERKDEVVSQLQKGIAGLLAANGVTCIPGRGTILGPGRVQVTEPQDTILLETKHILVATGSKPSLPPIPGIDLAGVLTSDDLLEGEPPQFQKLLIIGGGVIGVEFATIYASLGYSVEMVEAMERILPPFDKELAQSAAMNLKKLGVKIHTGARVSALEKRDGGLCCLFTEKGKEQSAQADAVLVAIGRKARIDGLLGPDVRLELENGHIVTDPAFRTSLPGVFAIGDVTGGISLAHMASAQGVAAAELLAGQRPSVDLNVVPSCVYTAPEIAAVGLTEAQAQAAGHAVKTGKYLMTGNGKTLLTSGERGFIKVVADGETGRILGAQMLCDRATDMIGEFATAIVNGLTAEDLSKVIRPHPTYGEGVTEAVEDVFGAAVHVQPKRKR